MWQRGTMAYHYGDDDRIENYSQDETGLSAKVEAR